MAQSYYIRVSDDHFDDIMAQELQDTYDGLLKDRQVRELGGNLAHFHNNREKDIKKLTKYIRAFERVLRYYTAN